LSLRRLRLLNCVIRSAVEARMDEHAATDRAVSFVRASGSRLYGAEEEVEADGFGLRPWGARREGRLWVVAFLPAEPPGVVSSAHAVFVYLDDASGEAEYLDGAVGRGWV
jgi:hypothetical protein